jgi:hypothetical protein
MLRDRLKIMLVKVCFLKCLSLGRDTSLISHRYPFFLFHNISLFALETNLLVPYFPID